MTDRKVQAPPKPPDSFTIEQIEAAIESVRNGKLCIPEKIIAELTTPVWKPQVGEVCFDESEGVYFTAVGNDQGELRPLTWVEVPRLQVALEALENIKEDTHASYSYADDALAKIKELTNEID